MVLRERLGDAQTAAIFGAAGVSQYLDRAPAGMVDESQVARLHHQVRRTLAPGAAEAIMTEAGDRTGRYILANRIPDAVIFLLRHLPAAPAAWLLTRAIGKHAWTFAGSGKFEIGRAPGRVIVARIAANPVVALETSDLPICRWHSAVFQRLFRELVQATASVTETACCAAGDAVCQFEIQLEK